MIPGSGSDASTFRKLLAGLASPETYVDPLLCAAKSPHRYSSHIATAPFSSNPNGPSPLNTQNCPLKNPGAPPYTLPRTTGFQMFQLKWKTAHGQTELERRYIACTITA